MNKLADLDWPLRMPSLILSAPMILIFAIGPIWAFGIAKLTMLDLALWSATTAASLIVATRIRRIDAQTLWLWIVFALLVVGYFAKTFYAAYWISENGSLEALNPEWSQFDMANLLLGYETASMAFLAFVLGVVISAPCTFRGLAVRHDSTRPRIALIVILVVAVALAMLRGWLGIGVMGVESIELPLGLSTVIFRTQSALIPAFLLIVMWSSEQRGDTALSVVSTMVLGVHLVAVAAVSASKAGLFYFAAYVLCLWVASDRLTNARKVLVTGLAVGAFAFFLIGAEFRLLRIEGLSLPEAVEAIRENGRLPLASGFDGGLRASFLRISGADGLWFVLGDSGYSAPLLDRWQAIWATSIRDVFTREIVDVAWLQDFRAPGFVAALIIVLGAAGIATCVLIGPLLAAAWRLLGGLPAGPALHAFSGVFILQTLMEGIFQWQDFVMFPLTIVLAAVFAIWLVGLGPDFLSERFLTAWIWMRQSIHGRSKVAD